MMNPALFPSQVHVGLQKPSSRSGQESGEGIKEISRDQLEAEERRRREDRRAQKSGGQVAASQSTVSERPQFIQSVSDSAAGADGAGGAVFVQDIPAVTSSAVNQSGRGRGGIRRGGRAMSGTADASSREENLQEGLTTQLEAGAIKVENKQLMQPHAPPPPQRQQQQPRQMQQSKSREQGGASGTGGKSVGRSQAEGSSARQSESASVKAAAPPTKVDAASEGGRPGSGQRFYRAGPTGESKGPGKESIRPMDEDESAKKGDLPSKQVDDIDMSKLTPRVNLHLFFSLRCTFGAPRSRVRHLTR